MSRFNKSLSVFVASLALTSTKIQAAQEADENPFESTFDPISIRPLNMPGDNLYAAHRSHSSHSSHRSSSSSYSAPSQPSSSPYRSYNAAPSQPANTAPRQPPPSSYNSLRSSTGSSQPVDPGRPATVTPNRRDFDPNDQALVSLVTRVQMALMIKGYDPGPIDGALGAKTKNALMHFQVDQGLEINGLMGTSTLNALGVVAR